VKTVEELWRLLGEAHRMPYGSAQIALVEQVIAHADAAGDRELSFAARILATTAYNYGGEQGKSFVSFSWCLADFDGDPAPFHARFTRDLLWYFKHMVVGLTNFPEVPLERTYAVLEDMERRYREGGHSLQAVYKHRYLVARHIGDESAAERWYERWIITPRDQLSDCAGCDPSSQVEFLVDRRRDDEAVALAEPVLAGQLTCSEQPQAILNRLLLPYVRTGRLELAADAHRRAYRLNRGNLADLWAIGDHLEFCALTGNEARGLEILQRHLDWLDRAPSPAAGMNFAASAAVLLRRLEATGHAGMILHRGAAGDRPSGPVTVSVLAAELVDHATALAARFDARNGTSFQGGRIADALAAQPFAVVLPLSVTARRRTPVVPPVPVVAPAPAAQIPSGADSEALIELVGRYERVENDVAVREVLRVFDERFGTANLPDGVAGRRAALRGAALFDEDDVSGAALAWQEAVDLLTRAGDGVRASAASGRLGVLACLTGDPESGLAQVQADVAYQAVHGDARHRSSSHGRMSVALMTCGRLEEALAAQDRADAVAAGLDEPARAAAALVRRAQILAGLGREDEAREAAEAGRAAYRLLGSPARYAAATLLHASLLDDPVRLLAAYDEVLAIGSRDVLVLNGRIGRARALLALDRPAEAVDEFVEAVACCTEQGIEDGAAQLRPELANAYRAAGRPYEAAEVAEEAVAVLQRMGQQAAADRCRYLLASIYRDLEDDEAAIGVYEVLATNLDSADDLVGAAQMREEAGDVLYNRDRDAQAAERYDAAAVSYHSAGAVLDELRVLRRMVLALHWAGEPEAAAAAVVRADERRAALPPDEAVRPSAIWEHGMLDYEVTRLLLAADKIDEALARIEGVGDRLRGIDAFGEALQADVLAGQALLFADRPGDAEPVLRAAVGSLPRESDLLSRAAQSLAEALDELGREDEAAAVRAEHDLDVAER
jgi:tetratricopeptide (TPR) repeat protein